VQCFTSPPTQYRLYGRRFLQVKRPNQQYQSTEGKYYKGKIRQRKQKYTYAYTIIDEKRIKIYSTTSLLVYTNMGTNQGMAPTRAGSPGLNSGGAATTVPQGKSKVLTVLMFIETKCVVI